MEVNASPQTLHSDRLNTGPRNEQELSAQNPPNILFMKFPSLEKTEKSPNRLVTDGGGNVLDFDGITSCWELLPVGNHSFTASDKQ